MTSRLTRSRHERIGDGKDEGRRPVGAVLLGTFTITPPPHGHIVLLALGRRVWPSVAHLYKQG